MEKKKQPDFTSHLHDQIIAISKAGAYDAIAPRMEKLQEQNINFRKAVLSIERAIIDADPREIAANPALVLKEIAKICSETIADNRQFF